MEFSDKGAAMLTKLEGFRRTPYLDVAHLLTIGVGHLLTSVEKDTGYIIIGGERCYYLHTGLSMEQVKKLLKQDCAYVVQRLNKYIRVPLSPNQFDCLVCFAFNIGTGAFASSTLLRLLNAGEYDAVPAQLARWNKAGGEVQKGLVIRREREAELWKNNVYFT